MNHYFVLCLESESQPQLASLPVNDNSFVPLATGIRPLTFPPSIHSLAYRHLRPSPVKACALCRRKAKLAQLVRLPSNSWPYECLSVVL